MSNNNLVWVTGASSGIGRAIVEELVVNSFSIAATSRKLSSLQTMIKQLREDKNKVFLFPADVKQSSELHDVYSEIAKKNIVTCLINNAGVTSFKSAEENSIAEIQEIIETNLLGSIYAIKAVLPDMIKNKSGTIINVLSVAAIKTFTNSSAYAASKSGLLAYTNSLREELRKYNIKVINIFPGATKTPIWSNDALEKYSDRMMSPKDISIVIRDILLLNGNIVPEEIVLRPIKGDL
ncbi:MAG: hypothetical protein CVV23_04110 [Ignavibacteriae bacterium HGW-Ignavibacteriae-2]|jgi:3-oxoacyl-[acyl-carrier protein] reductase|nr:SDR family NAD(P)-dependent oxidoreductase [Bacteroidota bacterium]PKL89663.1 MAG: hypothetical protein CVV23_04110 [Ignavibacteriae bacterium HGW-Ignavibacteriae-2]